MWRWIRAWLDRERRRCGYCRREVPAPEWLRPDGFCSEECAIDKQTDQAIGY